MHYVLRVSLPDKPGSLHALTGACVAAGADIVSLDVIERGGGFAIDDLCITVDDVDALRGAIDHLPGTAVASVRPVASARDIDGAVALAAAMVSEGRGAVRLLVDRLPAALWASWAVAVANGWSGMEVLAASTGALAPVSGGWLPLTTPRRLDPADIVGEPAARHDHLEIAAAPLGQPSSAVIVARRGGPRFVDRELRQLTLLAEVAIATEVAHTPRRPVERLAPPRRAPVQS
ncbi:MAG TPA: ACT domain-containing protein [Euzebyales bacterium]|nr:ACT domain-containing protein [Euzebyales bacterium]